MDANLPAIRRKQHKNTKIPPKHKRFADQYVVDYNGTQAAIRAGYNPKSAAQKASLLLTYQKIQSYITKIEENAAKELGITHRTILNDLKQIADTCKDKNSDHYSPGAATKALELLGKHLGTFDTKVTDLDKRPAFVGININMGDKPSIEMIREE